MAASKTTKKSPARSTGSNKKLVTNNNGQRKKVMILSLLAFAIVGVVVIARSFASTQIAAFGLNKGLRVANQPTSACTNREATSASKNNGAIIQLNCPSAGLGVNVHTNVISLSTGNYEMCAVAASLTSTANINHRLEVWLSLGKGRRNLLGGKNVIAPKYSNSKPVWRSQCVNFFVAGNLNKVYGSVYHNQPGILGVGTIVINKR